MVGESPHVRDRFTKRRLSLQKGDHLNNGISVIHHDDLGEELEFNEYLKSQEFKRCLDILDFLTKSVSLKLITDPTIQDKSPASQYHTVENTFAVLESSSEPPRILAQYKWAHTIWRSHLTRPLTWLLLCYWILKFFIVAILRYDHDTLVRQGKPLIRDGANRTEECAFPQDIYYEDSDILHKRNVAYERLELIGDSTISLKDDAVIFYFFASWATLCLYFAGMWLINSRSCRIDFLAFLTNPLAERRRIRLDLDRIISRVIESLEVYSCMWRSLDRTQKKQPEMIDGKRTDKSLTKEELNANFQHQHDNIQLVQLLHNIRCFNSVRPANLTRKWHKIISSQYFKRNISSIYASYFCGLFCVVFMTGIGLCLRAHQRVKQIECQRWNSNATLIEPATLLGDLEDSREREAYQNHDGSLINLIYLAFFIETRYFPAKMYLCFIESSLIMIFFSHWYTFYTTLFIFLIIDKFKWISQVSEQLEQSLHHFKNIMTGDRKVPEDEINLVRILTIAYLNYALLKNQHKHFRSLTNLFLSQMIFLSGVLMFVCYYVSMNTEKNFSQIPFAGLTYFMVVLNFYLLSSSVIFNKVTSMTKTIIKLLALGTSYETNSQSNNNLKFLMSLWYRQLTTRDEVLFSNSFCGVELSNGHIVTINIYMAALWIIFRQ